MTNRPKKPELFADLIARLDAFWQKEGCWRPLPYDLEMGAGTMHPATFFLALSREPARVAYPQPCRRPADARFGENPNRLGYYYQYQVLLKPPPEDSQEVYLRSLEFLGIPLEEHEVRFVEDNWESPTLGAWGIGWEVWLDGMEVTQFTYFQQMGGLDVHPVSVEITYGLERLALFLQDRENIFSLQWTEEWTYGDWHRPLERQFSAYYFQEANTERIRALFRLCAEEAEMLLQKGLYLPAYDYVLKLSHLFNILDARGVLSVAERTQRIQRIRNLAQQCARQYVREHELAAT